MLCVLCFVCNSPKCTRDCAVKVSLGVSDRYLSRWIFLTVTHSKVRFGELESFARSCKIRRSGVASRSRSRPMRTSRAIFAIQLNCAHGFIGMRTMHFQRFLTAMSVPLLKRVKRLLRSYYYRNFPYELRLEKVLRDSF